MTAVRDLDQLLVSEPFVRDPYPTLAMLRETEPVYWSESLGGWILTRYDDILATFRDVAAYSDEGRLGRASAYQAQLARAAIAARDVLTEDADDVIAALRPDNGLAVLA